MFHEPATDSYIDFTHVNFPSKKTSSKRRFGNDSPVIFELFQGIALAFENGKSRIIAAVTVA